MVAQHRELVFDDLGVAEKIARIPEPRDDAQRKLLAATTDHDRRALEHLRGVGPEQL
jgi:hypothetical protein